ncbi:MAG: alpha/beta hydrolase [Hyphomicrobium sp.]
MIKAFKKRRTLFKAPSRIWFAPHIRNLKTVSEHAPQQAADLAFALFCTPLSSERREARHFFLVQRARPFLSSAQHHIIKTPRGDIPTYIFEPERSTPHAIVLIAHGWTAESSFMALFAERLRQTGYKAILMDAPAHGKSKKRKASLIDYTGSVLSVAQAYKADYAIAHSMGCLAVLHAGSGGPPFYQAHQFKKYVLLAPPNKLSKITYEFAKVRNMSDRARMAFEKHLERIAHRPLLSYSGVDLLSSGKTAPPTLLIHSRDDFEIPICNSEEIALHYKNSSLLTFEGLGHRKILSAPPVVKAAIEFLRTPA